MTLKELLDSKIPAGMNAKSFYGKHGLFPSAYVAASGKRMVQGDVLIRLAAVLDIDVETIKKLHEKARKSHEKSQRKAEGSLPASASEAEAPKPEVILEEGVQNKVIDSVVRAVYSVCEAISVIADEQSIEVILDGKDVAKVLRATRGLKVHAISVSDAEGTQNAKVLDLGYRR